MHIEEATTRKKIEVAVEEVTDQDFDIIKEIGKFDFDWDKLRGEAVYKLVPVGTNDMAGLMALIDHPQEGFCYTEIKLIESARENIGIDKKYDRVAGSLLAFACRESFKNGYQGMVFLIPKTRLVSLYMQKYGFKNAGRGLFLDFEQSLKLISLFQ